MPTEPVLIGYTPRGTPVCDYLPDKPLLAPLLARLAQPDEADCEALTVLSLPVMAVQEEAPTSLEPIGAEAEAGRQPSTIVPHF
jgi:hypothetical protein